MDNRDVEAQKSKSKRRWGLISLVAFLIFPPIGVALFAARALDLLPNIGGEINLSDLQLNKDATRSGSDVWQKQEAPHVKAAASETRTAAPGSRTAAPGSRTAALAAELSAEKAVEKAKPKGMPVGNAAITFFGVVCAVLGGGFGLSKLAHLIEQFSVGSLLSMIGWFSLAAAGAVFAIYGNIRKNKKQRFEAYLKLIGDKQYVSIHELADVLGMDYRKVMRDLKEMIQRGILDPAWIDMKTYRLMLTEYTGEAVAEKKEEYLPRSDRILRQIRADNDLIADEEVSRKIDRIEDLTRKIFAIVDKYPEKENQLYSFLNYYLPTTLKTLESYARLEAQGIETTSIREAKQKINLMLDELADGYEKQLDKLFENDVVDISADIEVMRQMLQKDGLTEDEIMKAKR